MFPLALSCILQCKLFRLLFENFGRYQVFHLSATPIENYYMGDVLITNYIKQKEEIYYRLQDYMTISGKVEFLSVLRITTEQ
jgi:hypothetical protein